MFLRIEYVTVHFHPPVTLGATAPSFLSLSWVPISWRLGDYNHWHF